MPSPEELGSVEGKLVPRGLCVQIDRLNFAPFAPRWRIRIQSVVVLHCVVNDFARTIVGRVFKSSTDVIADRPEARQVDVTWRRRVFYVEQVDRLGVAVVGLTRDYTPRRHILHGQGRVLLDIVV